MKTLIVVFALFLLSANLHTQTWQTIDIPQAIRYDDVFFLNPQKGWACNNNGHIYQTNDGGQTWLLQFNNGNRYLRSIEFMNDSVGFCGGLDADARLYRTADGGQTWTNISAQIPGLPGGICGLSCPGNNVVYGCGRWDQPAYLIKSTDGGITWEKTDMSAWAGKLVDVFFITPDSGWVSGTAASIQNGGIILSTSDGGKNWHVKTLTNVSGDIVWKMQTPDSLHFFASIERFAFGANTQILKSSDGGANWSLRNVSLGQSRLQMIGFLDSLSGFCGSNSLFGTKDGGENWNKITMQPGENFNRFWRFSADSAIVSGGHLYRLSRAGTGQMEPVIPAIGEPCRLRVSPNPGNGLVNITVNLSQATSTWLAWARLDDKGLPTTLWTGEHPEGEYRFSADLRPGGNGSYVVWLKTNFGTLQEVVTVVNR